MSEPDIFISYSREDRPAARHFAECFVEEGFSVWWDAALHSGETFDEVIERNLRESKAVVVLWSPRSVVSRWVRAEATMADRKNKLAPAIIEPCDRPIIFELTHAADLSDWTGDTSDSRWRAFVQDLHRLVEANNDADVLAAARGPSRPQPSSRSQAAAGNPTALSSRRPLRPGNDDVILAAREHRPASIQRIRERQIDAEPPAAEPEMVEDELPAEVHCLETTATEAPPKSFIIPSSGATIGRTLPADLVLPHRSVSREHCMVGIANDELLVTDLNSTNGTFIDGQRVVRATILPVGSVLTIGQLSLKHEVRAREDALRRAEPATADEGGDLNPGRRAGMR